MHSIVRRFLKTGIAFLGVGLAIGLWIIVQREFMNRGPSPFVVSAHTHALLVGFVMMMILGVALWMFPRPTNDTTAYSPRAIAVAYWLVTLGTATRVAAELARRQDSALWLRATIVVAALCQVAGLAFYFRSMWPRIRAAGSRAREAAGERF